MKTASVSAPRATAEMPSHRLPGDAAGPALGQAGCGRTGPPGARWQPGAPHALVVDDLRALIDGEGVEPIGLGGDDVRALADERLTRHAVGDQAADPEVQVGARPLAQPALLRRVAPVEIVGEHRVAV